MKLTKLLLTAASTLCFIAATAQTYSKLEIQVDPAKQVWNSVQKALSEQRLSVAERSSDRLLTSYVVWSNVLTQNRGRIAVTLIGETLRIEMIDRQYSTGTVWSNAIGDLSKKNQEKYLLPLSSRVTELLSLQPALPAQGNLTAQNSSPTNTVTSNDAPIQGAPPTFSPSLCDNGICLEILQAKIIGQKLLIKGKMMSQKGNIEISIGVYHLKLIADSGEEFKPVNTQIGKLNSTGNVTYSLIEGIPVNFRFDFSLAGVDKIDFVQYYDFYGSKYYGDNSSKFSLKITNLPVPYNTDNKLTANGEVEIFDNVYLIPRSWEKVNGNLRLHVEFNNKSTSSSDICLVANQSRAVDEEGNEYAIKNLKCGNPDSTNGQIDYTIGAGLKVKGYLDIANGEKIKDLPLLELSTYYNTIRIRNLHPILK